MSGVLVVSLDHELRWGVRDVPGVAAYEPNLRGERAALRGILDLFREHEVHATWATVGFLFCRDADELRASLPEVRPRYADPGLDPYPEAEALEGDEEAEPQRLGASTLDWIAAVPHQEIGTHTFSHLYCLEPGQTLDAFRADLAAAVAVARRRGIELRSIVFPRNQVREETLQACADAGLVAYRGTEHPWYYAGVSEARNRGLRRALRLADAYLPLGTRAYRLGEVRREPLVNLPSSRFLRPWTPRLARLEPLRLRRIERELEHASRHDLVFHLWWHPHNFGAHPRENLAVLRRLLERFARLRERRGLRSLTMAEAAAETRG